MSVMDCYDPEGEFERVAGLAANDLLLTLTGQDPASKQKARSRCEITSALGAGRHWNDIEGLDVEGLPGHHVREDGWDLRFRVLLITESDPLAHSHARAVMRKFCAEMPWVLNGGGAGQMLNYVLRGPTRHVSTTINYKAEAGYYATVMDFLIGISVHQLAWAKLNLDDTIQT